MGQENKLCDLCGLKIEAAGFVLNTTSGNKAFCCEGCKGIYSMLHEDDILSPDTEEED